MKYDNIIIGAGPAGLQLGYYFKKANMNYVILEKSPMAGSFFDTFPHSGKLISINKKYTGTADPEFNLRHDWNSLLSDEKLLFTDYSEEYYPSKEDIVKYLNDFAKTNALNIIYNTTVSKIRKRSNGDYLIKAQTGTEENYYSSTKLIVATGLSKTKIPATITDNSKTKIKHYGDFEKDYFKKPENLDKYRNKSLLIIGNGNAAYELGNLLNPLCSSIAIAGKKPKEWAMSTHYTGDLRAVYIPLYDTFLLKSLNGFDYSSGKFIIDQETPTSQYTISFRCDHDACTTKHPYIPDSRKAWDHVILSTGWYFDDSIFDFDVELTQPNKKYPAINSAYESVNNENLFFIGSLMHSMDFKKSSGGFIHGFRYLIRYFFNLNYDRAFNVQNFKITAQEPLTAIVQHVIGRMNRASSLYQMYGQMCDIFYEDQATSTFVYVNDVHINHYYYNPNWPVGHIFILTLEYGHKEPVTDIYKLGIRITGLGSESDSTLLHPVLRVFKEGTKTKLQVDEIHFDEDLFANFTMQTKYIDKLERALKMFVDTT